MRTTKTTRFYEIYLLMHTGAVPQREGLGQGIHWHVENKVEYIATDKEEQEIPWIRVNRWRMGRSSNIRQRTRPIDASNLDHYTMHEMDCITCHNRISHLIPTPRNVVDKALYQGDLSPDIPYIRAQAVEVLTQGYETPDEAEKAIAELDSLLSRELPGVLRGKRR